MYKNINLNEFATKHGFSTNLTYKIAKPGRTPHPETMRKILEITKGMVGLEDMLPDLFELQEKLRKQQTDLEKKLVALHTLSKEIEKRS